MQTAHAPAVIDLESPWRDPKDGTRLTHLDWAASVARAIGRTVGFKSPSQEEDELVQIAHTLLLRRAIGDGCKAFDVGRVPPGGSADGLFRGWVHKSIHFECIRAVRRLRGGGTFHSPSDETLGVRVTALPNWTNELGETEDEAAVEDYRGRADDEAEEERPEVPVPIAKRPAAWMKCVRCGNRSKVRADEERACVLCGAAVVPEAVASRAA